jgi:hypothetical protein
MRKVILTIAAASLLYSCTNTGKDLPISEQDRALADSLHFDSTVISAIRGLTAAPLQSLAQNEDMEVAPMQATAFEFEYDLPDEQLKKFEKVRKHLKEKGYLLFKSEENYGNLPDKYAVLKSRDPFDIIRFRGTSGPNYEISNDSILSRLKDWHQRFSLEITGADADWVEVRFAHLPVEALPAFAKEVYTFCPDIVEQGAGNTESMVEDLKETGSLFLWWD